MNRIILDTTIVSPFRVLAYVVVWLSMIVPASPSQENGQRVGPERQQSLHITVADVIKMTQFADPDYFDGLSTEQNPARFSPDASRFLIVVKRGNIEKNTNDYSLLLFHAENVFQSPTPETLVSFSSSSNRPAIQDIQWVDDRTVAFLGENPDELQQLYEIDSETKRLTKLTNHSTNVISYAIKSDQRSFWFLASRAVKPLFDEGTARRGVVISSQPLQDLLAGESRFGSDVFADLFVRLKKSGQEVRVRARTDLVPSRLWLAPNARYLIVRTLVADIPEDWRNYGDRWLQERLGAKSLHGDRPLVYQYELIDAQSGQSESLLGTPLSKGRTEVLWAPDSRSVVVSGVYLPLNVADPAELKLRQSTKFIAEIEMPNREIVPISSKELYPLRWDPRTNNLLVEPTSYSSP
jgi:dipeptidyl aminopeptidase/acylaminoacyl peptidase